MSNNKEVLNAVSSVAEKIVGKMAGDVGRDVKILSVVTGEPEKALVLMLTLDIAVQLARSADHMEIIFTGDNRGWLDVFGYMLKQHSEPGHIARMKERAEELLRSEIERRRREDGID